MCKRNVTPPVRAGYRPYDWLARDAELRRVVTCIREGPFNQGEFGLFDDIYRALTEWGDTYFHLADFRSYADAQQRASDLHRDPTAWARKAVLNVARMGRVSSNRTIRRHAREIWDLQAAPVANCVTSAF
jgi:glycogen phosphorylase